MRLRGLMLAFFVCGTSATIHQSLINRMKANRREMAAEWEGAPQSREMTRMDGLLIQLLETDAYKDLTPQGQEQARLIEPTGPDAKPTTRTADRSGAPRIVPAERRPVIPRRRGNDGVAQDSAPRRIPDPLPFPTTLRWRVAAFIPPTTPRTAAADVPQDRSNRGVFAALQDPDEAEAYVREAWETESPVASDSPKPRLDVRPPGSFGPAGHDGKPRERVPVRPPLPPPGGNPSQPTPGEDNDIGVDGSGKVTPEKKAKKVQEQLDKTGSKLNDLPVRKEYRCMSATERRKFHDAVNLLKRQTIGNSNAYDTFVVFHNKLFAPGAYQGPGFLPWHRHFLWLFEKALREVSKDNSITLPYWDSSADADLPNPLTSALWRDSHMGSSRGNVVDGPFTHWITASGLPLQRHVSGDTTLLYNQEVFDYILAQNNYGRVVDVLELTHTGPHAYVGGQMANFSSSVMDPLFFMHLAFVDCLWEEWREKEQYENGIDPEGDYPIDSDLPVNHKVTSQMRPFAINNKAGLARVYTSLYYQYQPRNSCPADKCGCDRYGRDCEDALDTVLKRTLEAAPAWMRSYLSLVPDVSRDMCT